MTTRTQDPTNAKKFINGTIRDLNCMVTPGNSRLVKKREVVPSKQDLERGLTVGFFRQFCAPGWLSVWREPAVAPKAPPPKIPEQIPADVDVAIVAYAEEFKEDLATLRASYFSEMPRMTAEKIEAVAQERRDRVAAAEASKAEGDDEKIKEGGGEKEVAEDDAAEAKFREDLKTWAEANGIPQAAEYIDTATMEVLRQVEGKSPDEVMALLNPDDKEQDPSSDRGEGGDDEAGSEGGVPDTHVLDPFHEGEGEAQQIHKKTFNQYIRKTYPERDLNEAREAVGLPAMKED